MEDWAAEGSGDGPALGARPIVEVIRYIGEWTIRLLLITLAVTPARRLFNWPKLLSARRTLGVAAMSYVLIHFGLYIIDLNGDLAMVAREIVLRIYLTIGFVALIGLVALGSTSWDGAVQRLGSERWNQLHMLAYPITALGILHFFMQQKLDVTEPTLMAGLFVWLMGWRIAQRFSRGTDSLALVVLALASGVLTALLEAGWYLAATGVDPKLVLEANLAFDYSIRPAWWVAGLGLAIALASRLALQVRPLPARRTAQSLGKRLFQHPRDLLRAQVQPALEHGGGTKRCSQPRTGGGTRCPAAWHSAWCHGCRRPQRPPAGSPRRDSAPAMARHAPSAPAGPPAARAPAAPAPRRARPPPAWRGSAGRCARARRRARR